MVRRRNPSTARRGVVSLTDTPRIGASLFWSLGNQVTSSATSFVLTLYLVHTLAPSEFGLFGIGIAVILFYGGVGNALFLTQMVVHTPDKPPEDRPTFARQMFLLVIAFCGATILAAGTLMIALSFLWPAANHHLGYGLVVLIAAVVYLLKEFLIRHSYVVRREDWALTLNLGNAAAIALLLLTIYGLHALLTVERALSIYALGQVAALLIGYRLTGLSLQRVSWANLFSNFQLCWLDGRWALGGVSVTWLQSQAYVYLGAAILGSAGVGHANAARLFVAPFLMLIPAVNQLAMPRLSSVRVRDSNKVSRYGLLITLAMLALAVLYMLVLWLCMNQLADALLGRKYSNVDALVGMWCLVLLAQIARNGAALVLQTLKQFRILTLLNSLTAIIGVSATGLFAWSNGVTGAILGTAVGELSLAYLLWRSVERRESTPH